VKPRRARRGFILPAREANGELPVFAALCRRAAREYSVKAGNGNKHIYVLSRWVVRECSVNFSVKTQNSDKPFYVWRHRVVCDCSVKARNSNKLLYVLWYRAARDWPVLSALFRPEVGCEVLVSTGSGIGPWRQRADRGFAPPAREANGELPVFAALCRRAARESSVKARDANKPVYVLSCRVARESSVDCSVKTQNSDRPLCVWRHRVVCDCSVNARNSNKPLYVLWYRAARDWPVLSALFRSEVGCEVLVSTGSGIGIGPWRQRAGRNFALPARGRLAGRAA
jgi:hypothetical protein